MRWLRWTAALALGLGLLGLGVLRWAAPDRHLDPPGPHAIATESWVLVDEGRIDPLADEPTTRRFPVQAWYPADGPRGPVAVFVHGTQGRRHAYLTWIETLASHGYTVLAADHPPVALWPSFPDGTTAPRSSAFRALLGKAREPSAFTVDPVFAMAHAVTEADVRAMLDDVESRLGVSPDRVMLAGHSFGGSVVSAMCDREPRCAAVVNLDGPPFAEPDLPAVQSPMLVLLAGRTRTAPALDEAWRPLDGMIARARGPLHVYTLPEAGHLDLCDLGLLVRPTVLKVVFPSSQFGPGPLEPKLRAASDVSVAFADRWLRHERDVDLDQVARRHEVLVETRGDDARRP